MTKTVALLVLLILAAAILTQANQAFGGEVVEDSWVTVAPLPEPYYSNIWGAVAVNGKIYSVGDGVCECYDPDANNWTAVNPPPISSDRRAVVACQNKIYVIGDPTQVYDLATDTWENRTAMPLWIYGYQANVVNDKIYVISGGKPSFYSDTAASEVNYVYDPATDSWSQLAPIPIPVAGYASAVLDNKIYIIGGGTATTMVENATNIVQIYDPKKNQWTNGTPMPTGVYLAGACSTSGLYAPKRIYVVGGNLRYNFGGVLASYLCWTGSNLTQVYAPASGNWSTGAFLPISQLRSSLVNVNDTLYVVGGASQACWKYIPVGYSETPIPTPEPLPESLGIIIAVSVIIATLALVVVILAKLLVYYKKRKREVKP